VGVPPGQISWVIPNHIWMTNRGGSSPHDLVRAVLKNEGDLEKALDEEEKSGRLLRLDPKVRPTQIRFPVVGEDELATMRKVLEGLVKRGRVSAIELEEGKQIRVIFNDGGEPWCHQDLDHVFVHCTSPGPYSNAEGYPCFPRDDLLNMGMLFAPPLPLHASMLAKLEMSRVRGRLNLQAGRELMEALGKDAADLAALPPTAQGEAMLRELMIARSPSGAGLVKFGFSTMNEAAFYCLFEGGPAAAFAWVKANRLSFLGSPRNPFSSIFEELELVQKYGEKNGLGAPLMAKVGVMLHQLVCLQVQ